MDDGSNWAIKDIVCYIPIVVIVDNDIKRWSMTIDEIFVSYRIVKPEYMHEPKVFIFQRSYIAHKLFVI